MLSFGVSSYIYVSLGGICCQKRLPQVLFQKCYATFRQKIFAIVSSIVSPKLLAVSVHIWHASTYTSQVKIFQTQQLANVETRGLVRSPILGGK